MSRYRPDERERRIGGPQLGLLRLAMRLLEANPGIEWEAAYQQAARKLGIEATPTPPQPRRRRDIDGPLEPEDTP